MILFCFKFDNMHNSNKSEKHSLSKNENIIKFPYNTKEYHQEEGRFNSQNMIKFNHRYSQLPSNYEQTDYPEGQHQVQEVNYVDENYGSGPQYLTYEAKPSKFYNPAAYAVPHQQLVLTVH
jgi:hypothetical protein